MKLFCSTAEANNIFFSIIPGVQSKRFVSHLVHPAGQDQFHRPIGVEVVGGADRQKVDVANRLLPAVRGLEAVRCHPDVVSTKIAKFFHRQLV